MDSIKKFATCEQIEQFKIEITECIESIKPELAMWTDSANKFYWLGTYVDSVFKNAFGMSVPFDAQTGMPDGFDFCGTRSDILNAIEDGLTAPESKVFRSIIERA